MKTYQSAALGAALIAAVAIPRVGHSTRRPVKVARADEWSLVLARPGNGKYEDFAFPTEKQGWLVGAAGDVLHTTDGGLTWELQASKMGTLRSVDFLDEKRGYAGTVMGKLYATTDGGVTWSDISSTLPQAPRGFCGMAHVGDRMHIVGRYWGRVADYYYSPDAGKTWRYTDMSDFAQALIEVQFLNESVGFMGGMSKSEKENQGTAIILKTTDGGKSWREVFKHDGGRGYAWKIWPISPKLIYASLQSQDGTLRIAKTTDGGEKWETHTVTTGMPLRPGVQGIGFIDDKTGWIGGFFPGMYGTTDGGKTWSFIQMDNQTFNRFEKVGNTLVTAGYKGIVRLNRR